MSSEHRYGVRNSLLVLLFLWYEIACFQLARIIRSCSGIQENLSFCGTGRFITAFTRANDRPYEPSQCKSTQFSKYLFRYNLPIYVYVFRVVSFLRAFQLKSLHAFLQSQICVNRFKAQCWWVQPALTFINPKCMYGSRKVPRATNGYFLNSIGVSNGDMQCLPQGRNEFLNTN
jgi:hypothetical protein